MIGNALTAYANANGGAYPPSLSVLVSNGTLQAKYLVCPDAPSGTTTNYILAATSMNVPANAIILYEPITNHVDGINVLYRNGQVVYFPQPQAQNIIAGLQGRTNWPALAPPPLPTIIMPTPHISSAPPAFPFPRNGLRRRPNVSPVLPEGASKTEMLGSMGGSPYVRVDPAKRLVIGFGIRIGSWSNHPTLGYGDPLYTRDTGSVPSNETICLAKDGYAVGGIVVNQLDGADGLQIIFMRIKGAGVDINDSYTSPWFGDTDGSNRTQLAGHGERVIGTFGRQGMNNNAIGLVIEPAPANGP